MLIPKLIDAHAHLESQFFGDYRDEALKKALDEKIFLINAGVDKKSSQEAIEIANKNFFGVWAAVGQHPTENENFDYDFYKNLAFEKKVVAIGECGLDYYRVKNDEGKKLQKEIFIRHIELANKFRKPLMIHCRSGEAERASSLAGRDAHRDLLKLLNANRHKLIANPGVMHFFGGNGAWENVEKYLDLGFYISFAGVITFANYSHIEDIKRLPLDRILLETDAPFAAPELYRGKKNEPVYIVETARKMAEIKGVSFEEICRQTAENTKVVFNLKI